MIETAIPRPHIGVISDCALQRHVLQKVLCRYGLNIAIICDPSNLEDQLSERMEKVDCWILELDDEELESEALEQLIETAAQPILFGLGKAPQKHDEHYISWERRLLTKLEEHLGRVEILESEESINALDQDSMFSVRRPAVKDRLGKVADDIWVLAASLGGPAAVKAFLDEMPSNINTCFLYAQHVDSHFSTVLTNVLGRHSQLDLKSVQQGDILREGEVLVVPVDKEITFGDQGVAITQNAWQGPYGPSIDHLLSNLVNYYGKRCHVIVFSGMGNDGAMTASRMKDLGCSIWTQSPDSCANGSMPQSIIDLDCSELTGTPTELACAFIERYGQRPELSNLN